MLRQIKKTTDPAGGFGKDLLLLEDSICVYTCHGP